METVPALWPLWESLPSRHRLEVGCWSRGWGWSRAACCHFQPRGRLPAHHFPSRQVLGPKARSLGTDLRASNLEQQALALALMGCVTLDKSTPFTESPLSAWNQRTVRRCSHLLFQLDFIFAHPAQLLGSPGTSPMWTADWERGRLLWEWPAVGLGTGTLPFCM